MTESGHDQPDPGERPDEPGRRDHPDAPAERRDGSDAPGGSDQGPPAADPYQDFWLDGWDQPPVREVAPDSPWAAPYPQQPGTEWPATGHPAAPAGYSAPAAGYPTPAGYTAPAGYPGAGYQPSGFVAYPVPAGRSRRPWILGVVAAVLLLVFGGGGLVAYQALNGGGEQPEQAVPAGATAFFKLDLNPSASQKINLARLLHRVPNLGGLTGSGDWRRQMFQSLAEDGSVPPGLSYDRDIKPWLGERAAVAVLPDSAGGATEPLLVLQCTDDNKARAAFARFGVSGGIGFVHGYAVIAQSQPLADRAVADAKAASLGANPTYRADLGRLGASGIAAGWADLSAVNGLAGGLTPAVLAPSGRIAFTVRVTPNAIDLVGRFTGSSGSSRSMAAPKLDGLPAGTAVAVSAGLDPAAIDQSWHRYQDLLDQSGLMFGLGPDRAALGASGSVQDLELQYGIRLPNDLTTLLGSGVTVSVAAHGVSGGSAAYAVQTHTDGTAAVRVLDRIRGAVQANGEDFPLSYRATSSGLVVSDDPGYLATLNGTGSATLGNLKGFHSALPELSGASVAGFVNLDAIVADMRADPDKANDVQTLSAFRALGLTVHTESGSASLHIRLLAH